MILNRKEVRRLVVRGTLIALIAVLMLAGIGLLIASILLAFLTITQPAVATLLTALCVAVVISLLAMFLMIDRRRRGGSLGELGRLLPGLQQMIKQKPMGAVGVALALGIVTELMQRGGGSSSGRRSDS